VASGDSMSSSLASSAHTTPELKPAVDDVDIRMQESRQQTLQAAEVDAGMAAFKQTGDVPVAEEAAAPQQVFDVVSEEKDALKQAGGVPVAEAEDATVVSEEKERRQRSPSEEKVSMRKRRERAISPKSRSTARHSPLEATKATVRCASIR
jgi:predicted TIM-barrel fold metal-dependent hydrolase